MGARRIAVIVAVRRGLEGGGRIVDRGRMVGQRGHRPPVHRARLKRGLRLLRVRGFSYAALTFGWDRRAPQTKEDVTWVYDGSQ